MAEQLFQIGIKGLIRNAESEILLLNIPKWRDTTDHWDLPGGRMEPGENFRQTLRRELLEEIGIDYPGQATHVMTVLSNVTIPVGDDRVPLVLVVFMVDLKTDLNILLDPNGPEQVYEWVNPVEASQRLQRKYPAEFCDVIAKI